MDVPDQQSFWISQQARFSLQPLGPGAETTGGEADGVLTVLGSGKESDIILPSGKADGAHTAIVLLGNCAYACDLGAPGGTSLNGRRIRWARLADGDELAVNDCRFLVELRENAESATGEQPSFGLHNSATIGRVMSIDPVLIVGSDPGCDVVLSANTAAGRQCIVAWTQEGPVLRNLRCDGNVRLNGEIVQTARLVSGDMIRVGSHDLTFEIDLGAGDFAGLDGVCNAGEREAGMSEARRSGRSIESNGRRIPSLISGKLAGRQAAGLRQLWADGGAPEENTAEGFEQCAEAKAAANTGFDEERDEPRVDTAGSATGEDGDDVRGEESEGKFREDALMRMKARVAAAQEALDRRAIKHLDRLNRERIRLQSYQAELQQKASELLRAARENRRLLERQRQAKEAAPSTDAPVGDGGRIDSAAAQPAALSETATSSNPAGKAGENDESPMERNAETLQEHATALAALVRLEQDEIDKAESYFASLRLGIERLRDFVSRAEGDHRVRSSEWEARLATLREEEAGLSRERETVATRLRELEAESAKNRAKMEEAARDRQDLDHELEQIAQTQKKLMEKEEALRAGLELERRRIEVRQAELQRKAADLARTARDKRCMVEANLFRRRAALDLQEAELQAHRASIEESSRVELEKAALELERVLSMPLPDSRGGWQKGESAIQSCMAEAAERVLVGSKAVQNSTEQRSQPGPKEVEEQTKALAEMLREAAEGREKRLAILREELLAIKSSMGRLASQKTEQGGFASASAQRASLAETSGRCTLRRVPPMFGGQMNKIDAVLRGAKEREADRRAGAEIPAAAAALNEGEPRGGEERSEGR